MKSQSVYHPGMFMMWIVLGCGGGETARLESEVARLETKVASMQTEIDGLRRSNSNLEMLERASASAVAPIPGQCRLDDDGDYRMTVDLLKAIQAAPEALVREGRWVPSSAGGVNAWRAVHIRRGSLMASCGIRNGDVLLSVNGSQDATNWVAILQRAEELESLEVELLRAHSKQVLRFRLD